MQAPWYQKSYRRTLVDMHIEEWNPAFLAEFDADAFVKTMKDAHAQSTMVYANSHIGYMYYPSKTGHQNAVLNGRDMVKEIELACKKYGIDIIIYYSVIFNNWAYEEHPDWRVVDLAGTQSRDALPGTRELTGTGIDGFKFDSYDPYNRRYGLVCPNAPGYREFVRQQMIELCENYSFVSVFPDMTFWPRICYCQHCRKRFAEEVGGELPTVVDWNDPRWVAFQRKREEWMADFAHLVSETLWEHNPGVMVYHQTSSITQPWERGMTMGVMDANDYAGGDFYEGFIEQSAVCKMCYNITKNMPFEFMTSASDPDLRDHTSRRYQDLMRLHTYITLAHNGAFMHIDAIDPVGTINPRVYEKLKATNEETMRYDPYLKGTMAQDVAVYYTLASNYDPDVTGPANSGIGYSTKLPHLKAVLSGMNLLIRDHIPCGIISEPNLSDLSRYQVLVLPEIFKMTDEAAAAIRTYVQEGGRVMATGRVDPKIADILGITVEGFSEHPLSYIRPEFDDGLLMHPDVTAKYPMQVNFRQVLVHTADGCEVIGRMTLPYSNVLEHHHFASIHSTPPGIPTEHPSIVRYKYGKGETLWTSVPLEMIPKEAPADTYIRLVRSLLTRPLSAMLQGPQVVEVLRFDDEDGSATVRLVNVQEKIPILPVYDLTVSVHLGGRNLKSVSLLPDESPLQYTIKDGYVHIHVDKLDMFAMIKVDMA